MKIVVLSDGKPGHYNQSLGIVQRMPACDAHWIDVRFRSKFRDNLLRCLMCLIGWMPLPRSLMCALLRWSCHDDTYVTISDISSADCILSTGSSVAAVNLLLGRIFRAKTVTCRRPSPLGTRDFDLAILPMLSWPRRHRKNICKTVGVPNQILPANLDALKASLARPDCPRIGVLIGGTDKHEHITEEDAAQLLVLLSAVAEKTGAEVLVTTSRRTPPPVRECLANVLKSAPWCHLFVEPDDCALSATANPYQAILALSELLIVTADSFSMVCEAASSGRPVIVLTLSPSRTREPKRYQVYRYLEERSIVHQCSLHNLAEQVLQLLQEKRRPHPLDDTATAVDAICRLFERAI